MLNKEMHMRIIRKGWTPLSRLPRAALLGSIAMGSLAAASVAQAAPVQWPSDNYDPAIPTLESVLDYAPGDRITWAGDVRRYFDALAAAAPERVRLVDYARSWEGRGLFYAVISSPANMAATDELRQASALRATMISKKEFRNEH
ncbi:MAG: hypothetical protein ACI87W_001376 [Halieaceae bacterium]